MNVFYFIFFIFLSLHYFIFNCTNINASVLYKNEHRQAMKLYFVMKIDFSLQKICGSFTYIMLVKCIWPLTLYVLGGTFFSFLTSVLLKCGAVKNCSEFKGPLCNVLFYCEQLSECKLQSRFYLVLKTSYAFSILWFGEGIGKILHMYAVPWLWNLISDTIIFVCLICQFVFSDWRFSAFLFMFPLTSSAYCLNMLVINHIIWHYLGSYYSKMRDIEYFFQSVFVCFCHWLSLWLLYYKFVHVLQVENNLF